MKTDYRGIDYSLGHKNVDSETGIHYGVIPHHEVGQAWYERSTPYYGDMECTKCGTMLSEEDIICPNCGTELDPNGWDCVEPISFYFEDEDYSLEQGSDNTDIFILKSPYFTFAQFCSPCAPGAGYLMNWTDPDVGVKTYCLGHDWIEARPTGQKVQCEYCKGIGLREKANIPNYNEEVFAKNGGNVFNDEHVECWVCNGYGEVDEYVNKAPYPVYSVKTGKLVDPYLERNII